MQGESIISTAIMTPEGIATGKEWNTKHADIIKESETIKMALAAGMDIDQIDANKGFIIQDADGKQQFVGRKRALEAARKSGQVDESMLYDPEGHGLISEALVDVPAKSQAKSLDDTLNLLKKKEPEPSAVIRAVDDTVEKQRMALIKNLADKQSEWNLAKAVGDMDDAAALRGEPHPPDLEVRVRVDPGADRRASSHRGEPASDTQAAGREPSGTAAGAPHA